ncbi:MAG TPA: SDR family NAD(P)-dependent oxidoreductase, partial [Niastella sp.]|nr:SDR family NAD(P)-dependent oxidoreductase [Niastella sp.]
MDLHLTNKVFIVTGGAKGIGAAISSSIAAEGGVVVIAGRKAADNQAKVDEIIKAKGKATHIAVELAEPAACKEVIDFTVKEYGRIDGIINNAGVNDGVGLE